MNSTFERQQDAADEYKLSLLQSAINTISLNKNFKQELTTEKNLKQESTTEKNLKQESTTEKISNRNRRQKKISNRNRRTEKNLKQESTTENDEHKSTTTHWDKVISFLKGLLCTQQMFIFCCCCGDWRLLFSPNESNGIDEPKVGEFIIESEIMKYCVIKTIEDPNSNLDCTKVVYHAEDYLEIPKQVAIDIQNSSNFRDRVDSHKFIKKRDGQQDVQFVHAGNEDTERKKQEPKNIHEFRDMTDNALLEKMGRLNTTNTVILAKIESLNDNITRVLEHIELLSNDVKQVKSSLVFWINLLFLFPSHGRIVFLPEL